ncbi:MAG: hypothetical protein KKD21_10635, partial [Proteobacteria bacterium]|nr:hypothetical protein [Pseudomonadota bacterium]
MKSKDSKSKFIDDMFEDFLPNINRAFEILKDILKRPSAMMGGILLLLILLTSVLFPLVFHIDPLDQDLLARFSPPVW